MRLKHLTILLIFLVSLVPAHSENNITTDAVNNEIEQLAETQNTNNINPGTTPDKAGYGLKIALEKIGLAFTFNKEKRTQLALNLAEKRLEEARLMANENKIDALLRAKEEHKKLIEKVKSDLKDSGDSEADLDKRIELENNLEDQGNRIEDLESAILVKTKGLTDEQRQKLLDLIEEFKNQTADVKVKVSENKQEIITKLRAKGFNETKIEEKEAKLEANAERFVAHEINQSEKMFELASKLIEKAQTEKNITIKQETLDLKTKAEAKLNEAKQALTDKRYKESVELARESKKLSVLTIASIRGKDNKLVKKRLNDFKEMEKIREEKKDLAEKIREEQKNLREKIKEENKNKLEKLKEEFKSKSERNSDKKGESSKSNNSNEIKPKENLDNNSG
ncbi:MAG: DUF5667 domain-containing protein [Nanoarchaeota archaeon]